MKLAGQKLELRCLSTANRAKCLGRMLLVLGVFLAAGDVQGAQLEPKTSTPAAKPQSKAPAVKAVLEPKAIDLLKAMSGRLAAARSMTFTAAVTYESPSRLGPALVYTTISEVTMQRPDKLRVITPGDGPASEFYYDGKTMAASRRPRTSSPSPRHRPPSMAR
jgi:hypothetical protein